MHLCVCLGVCRMDESERYRWDFDLFLIFIHTNINRGISAILGVEGYQSSQMWGILHIFRVMSKIHLSGL